MCFKVSHLVLSRDRFHTDSGQSCYCPLYIQFFYRMISSTAMLFARSSNNKCTNIRWHSHDFSLWNSKINLNCSILYDNVCAMHKIQREISLNCTFCSFSRLFLTISRLKIDIAYFSKNIYSYLNMARTIDHDQCQK